MLKEVFGDNAISWRLNFNSTNNFLKDGNMLTMMNVGPVTSRTEGKFQNINEIVWKDQQLIMRMIANMVNTNKDITKQCAKMLSKYLIQEQANNWKHNFSNVMEQLTEEPDLLTNVTLKHGEFPVMTQEKSVS